MDKAVWELKADLDDASPQLLGHVRERLEAAGARDVVMIPVLMKKGRPGVRLEVLADDALLGKLEDLILNETTTLGLRRQRVERRVLPREVRVVRTRYGPIRLKRALCPDGSWKAAPEYEDCRKAALKARQPIRLVMAEALRAR